MPEISELSWDDLEVFEAKMTITQELNLGGNTVRIGSHEDHGTIYLVVPPVGLPFILPFASQLHAA